MSRWWLLSTLTCNLWLLLSFPIIFLRVVFRWGVNLLRWKLALSWIVFEFQSARNLISTSKLVIYLELYTNFLWWVEGQQIHSNVHSSDIIACKVVEKLQLNNLIMIGRVEIARKNNNQQSGKSPATSIDTNSMFLKTLVENHYNSIITRLSGYWHTHKSIYPLL